MNQENGEEKRPPGFNRPFSLLLIYQLTKAILWSDEWGAPQGSSVARRSLVAVMHSCQFSRNTG